MEEPAFSHLVRKDYRMKVKDLFFLVLFVLTFLLCIFLGLFVLVPIWYLFSYRPVDSVPASD